jgi:dipeptidyl aminopeptidase/acylaminoacyl peptidase
VEPAVSAKGRLAYRQRSFDTDVWRVNLNGHRAAQPATRLISSTRIDHDARYSPDGERIAFASNRSGSLEVWVCNSDGSGTVQLTSFRGPNYTGSPRWSPDGKLIAFPSAVSGKHRAYVMNAEGGKAEQLPIDDLWNWSRDGKWVYFGSKRNGEQQLWKMPWPLTRELGAVQITKKGCAGEAVESFDRKFIYYLKGPTDDHLSLWKVPAEGGEETQVLGSVLNNNFALGDQGIYFIPNVQPASIRFMSFASGATVTIAKVKGYPSYGFSLSPDGKSLSFAEFEVVTADLMLVENFR